jgi:hypothetical protein
LIPRGSPSILIGERGAATESKTKSEPGLAARSRISLTLNPDSAGCPAFETFNV